MCTCRPRLPRLAPTGYGLPTFVRPTISRPRRFSRGVPPRVGFHLFDPPNLAQAAAHSPTSRTRPAKINRDLAARGLTCICICIVVLRRGAQPRSAAAGTRARSVALEEEAVGVVHGRRRRRRPTVAAARGRRRRRRSPAARGGGNGRPRRRRWRRPAAVAARGRRQRRR
ncbi:hypothetical protein [Oryza sativa Japonica Group]|uniref:Uncharacterized protein n=1 Tax=Oryza sativa subsp. japonica TaxID=39947 RepID=Q5QMM4_ORYSJ|nr:hypothetical protein DAI22_01g378300 [Oryza sativa Japonica Group]BAD73348.1 hypothetical protein [Oryza sativa Japonica Group]